MQSLYVNTSSQLIVNNILYIDTFISAEFSFESSIDDPLFQYYEVRCVVVGTKETKVALYIIDGEGNRTSVQENCPQEYNCTVNSYTTASNHSRIVTHNVSVYVEWSDDAPDISVLFKSATRNSYGDLVFMCQAEDIKEVKKYLRIQGTYRLLLYQYYCYIVYISIYAVPFDTPYFTSPPMISSDSIIIRWNYTNTSDVYGYLLTIREWSDNGVLGGSVHHDVTNGTINVYTFTALEPNTRYSVTIRGYQNLLGQSSTVLEARTLQDGESVIIL